MSEQAKKTFVHIIRESYCKGCNICVSFCPRHVLSLREGKVWAEFPKLCIGCKMCELRCPDFAIEIQEGLPEEECGPEVPEIDLTTPQEAKE